MKFKKLILMLEKNIYYKTPKDKELQLYDFYMLTLLRHLPPTKKDAFSSVDDSMRMSVEEGADTIVNDLLPSMKSAINFAVAAEFRHIFANNSSEKIKKFFAKYGEKDFIKKYAKSYKLKQVAPEWDDRDRKELVNRFKENGRGYQDSYEALKKTKISTSKFMTMAADAFKNLNWSSSYGGKPWAMIAEGWLKLDRAKNYNDKVIAIDHAYDLQHNTGTVFNKLKSYYKEGYGWIKNALDKKASIKNVWELIDNVSGSVKSMTGYIAKDRGYGTLEDFKKNAKIKKIVYRPNTDKPKDYDLKFSDDLEFTNFTLHDNDTIKLSGVILKRVTYSDGSKGGYAEKESNIQGGGMVMGNAKIYGNAKVTDNAKIYGDAIISGNAQIKGNARIYGNAKVTSNASVYGNTRVYDNAKIAGTAKVYEEATIHGNSRVYDTAQVYGNAKVYGKAKVYGDAKVYGNSHVAGSAEVYDKAQVYGTAAISDETKVNNKTAINS